MLQNYQNSIIHQVKLPKYLWQSDLTLCYRADCIAWTINCILYSKLNKPYRFSKTVGFINDAKKHAV